MFCRPITLRVLNCITETRAANTFLEGCTWPVGHTMVNPDINHQTV